MAYLSANPGAFSPWIIVVGSAFVAAFFDLRSRRIPNLLTGPLFLVGIACAAWMGGGNGLASGILGCLVMAAPFFALWCFAGGGAADAKLMGALGAWLGLATGSVTLVCVLMCGVVMGIGWAVWTGRWAEVLGNVLVMSHGLASTAVGRRSPRQLAKTLPDHRAMLKMPYGVAICAGVCVAAIGVRLWHI